jgi:hypothetical protein
MLKEKPDMDYCLLCLCLGLQKNKHTPCGTPDTGGGGVKSRPLLRSSNFIRISNRSRTNTISTRTGTYCTVEMPTNYK